MSKRERKRQAHCLAAQIIDQYLSRDADTDEEAEYDKELTEIRDYHFRLGEHAEQIAERERGKGREVITRG
jgi:hypothetical protein